MCFIYPVRYHWRKLIFLLQKLSTGDSFCVRDVRLCLFPCLSARIQFGLNSVQHELFMLPHIVSVSSSVLVMLSLEDTVSVLSYISSNSYNLLPPPPHRFQNPEGSGLIETPHLD